MAEYATRIERPCPPKDSGQHWPGWSSYVFALLTPKGCVWLPIMGREK